MAKFKVGEIVLINSVSHPQFNGTEVEIEDCFIWVDGFTAYHVKNDPSPRNVGWYERALKKLPPKEDIISWEDMKEVWKPKTVKIASDEDS